MSEDIIAPSFTKDQTLFELSEARRLGGTIGTDMDALSSGLAYLYIYCPEELKDFVYVQMMEIERRKLFMLLNPRIQ